MRAEEAIRESEQRYRRLIETAHEGIWTIDSHGRTVFVNQRMAELLGYAPEELLGRVHTDLMWEADRPERDADMEGRRQGAAAVWDERYHRKDGGEIRTLASCTTLYDPDGTFAGALGMFTDITGRRRAEEALREQSALTAAVASNAAEALYLLDAEGLATYSNPAAEQMFGWTLEEMRGAKLHNMIHYKHPDGSPFPMADCGVGQCFASGRTLPNHEDVFVRRDGSFVPVLCSMASIRHDGRVTGAVLAVSDITERKRAEAERTSRMKDEFLATLSHELRTPLSAILGWSQILRRGNARAETLAEGLNTIERNARAQTQIIEDLLDMSRIISGKISLNIERTDLSAVVRAAIETVLAAATAKGIELVFAVPADDPRPILADPTRLQQVFWNLLSNAIKFTPRGGVVRVGIEQRDTVWQVDVADSGEGISPDFLPYVFEKFRQQDGSTTRRHGGLGLGLSIVRQLAELHGGTVRASSAGPGRGATFTVSFPISAPHAEAPRRQGGNGDGSDDGGISLSPWVRDGPAWDAALCEDLAGMAVLVVDDEADARALLLRLLSDCKAKVRWRRRPTRRWRPSSATAPTCSSATSACPARTATRCCGGSPGLAPSEAERYRPLHSPPTPARRTA